MSFKQNSWMFVCTVVMASVVASAAHAESGFFLGANFGTSNYDVDSSRTFLPPAATLVRSETDDSGSAVSVAVGYRFGRYFGVEASYVDLGSASGKDIWRVSFPVVHEAPAESSLGVTGPAVMAFAVFPLSKFEPYVRAGVLFAETEFDFLYSEFISGQAFTNSTGTTETAVGLGVAYLFTEQIAFKLDWTRYLEVGDEETGEVDIDSLTVGLRFTF
jgi:opacity protein-like surface antigen